MTPLCRPPILAAREPNKREPMPLPMDLAPGDHDLTEPVASWTAQIVSATSPTVELVAALLSHPHPPVFSSARGQTDTTLTIRMDLKVAMSLYSQLGELGRSTGWLAQEEG